MRYCKYQALGNVYLVMEPKDCEIKLNTKQVQRLCDPHYGLASDGILVGPIYKNNEIHVEIINPDGSYAERSGNGLRIFARYLWDQNYVEADNLTLCCVQQKITATRHSNQIRLNLGQVSFDLNLILNQSFNYSTSKQSFSIGSQLLHGNCCSVGNPHTVLFFDEVNEILANRFGPIIENDIRFKNRTNVQFVQVIDRHQLRLEIWERGAGYTLSSGTSSCAAVAVAHYLGYVDHKVTVTMPGGVLQVMLDDDYNISIQGDVFKIEEGFLARDLIAVLKELQ